MDLRTAVTAAALFLMTADVCLTQSTERPLERNSSISTPASSSPCSCPNAATPPTPTSTLPAPVVYILSVRWTECEGEVVFHNSTVTSSVCFDSVFSESGQGLFQNVCKDKPGCKGTAHLDKNGKELSCLHITEMEVQQKQGKTLRVKCTVERSERDSDVKKQLWTYKVMTALLCCVLVIFLLIRFTKPTVKALQRRLSDKRQNRWIGPTQSHSVSYQRGKTVKNDDGEKRLSYPALERLTVSDSREPSSNRNSGFNF